MDAAKKKNLFLACIGLLVVILIIVAAVMIVRGPRTSAVEKIGDGDGDTWVIDDVNDGKITIPRYDIPTSTYNRELFAEKNGVITYENGKSALGINVNQNHGDINWDMVKESGVSFAMIRVGFRGWRRGQIEPDSKFEENITGAAEAGIKVGVYFFSQAMTEAEAEEEASFVLQQIQGHQVNYPIAFDWEFVENVDESKGAPRTKNAQGDQITACIGAFCNKISKAGFTPCYFADKEMGYEVLDLSKLSGYDLWYSEYKKEPSFYYNYKIWQYTNEGDVPGITEKVPVSIAMEAYAS